MKFVRWQRYGFTHVVRSEGDPPKAPWLGATGTTLCGNWWDDIHLYDRESTPRKGVLPPSETDDGKRPLCGTCRKIAKL